MSSPLPSAKTYEDARSIKSFIMAIASELRADAAGFPAAISVCELGLSYYQNEPVLHLRRANLIAQADIPTDHAVEEVGHSIEALLRLQKGTPAMPLDSLVDYHRFKVLIRFCKDNAPPALESRALRAALAYFPEDQNFQTLFERKVAKQARYAAARGRAAPSRHISTPTGRQPRLAPGS